MKSNFVILIYLTRPAFLIGVIFTIMLHDKLLVLAVSRLNHVNMVLQYIVLHNADRVYEDLLRLFVINCVVGIRTI